MALTSQLLPITPPTGEIDFHKCSADFGSQILPLDCQTAGQQLPSGTDPITFNLRGQAGDANTLPIYKQHHSCTIAVEYAGPDYAALNTVELVPNHLRGLAGYIIGQCPGGADDGRVNLLGPGVGGYVTQDLDNIDDWIVRSEALVNQPQNFVPLDGGYIGFITVTVKGSRDVKQRPGDTDYAVARRLYSMVHARWQTALAGMARAYFYSLQEKFYLRTEQMNPENNDSGPVNWWDPVSAALSSKMTYDCDSSLGSPAVSDCDLMEWQGFGPDNGTVEVGLGNTKFFSQNTCYLAVSATTNVILTWAQVTAAFDTLVSLCIENPLSAAQGGRAYFGTPPISTLTGKRRSARKRGATAGASTIFFSLVLGREKSARERNRERDGIVTGLNALPAGANVTLWKHNANAPMGCEWAAAQDGKAVDSCGPSRN